MKPYGDIEIFHTGIDGRTIQIQFWEAQLLRLRYLEMSAVVALDAQRNQSHCSVTLYRLHLFSSHVHFHPHCISFDK
jgi:hypothetical protein